ncbi:hypothetical protein FGA82_17940 [Pseudomonas fluorescens]|uniref:hypothetical protein n=1 Tax=Pseudomonas fluorescens TaxID=294 RepID=UPI0011309A60|nr:hypothetical protein [Pseudomonas fluorescens]TMU77504.1 hypothetical protein FGA82_17940 [Pseudomonas fluorescens]
MIEPLAPLTDAQVQAGARPGESWAQARRRLEAARGLVPADEAAVPGADGADCIASGFIDECEGPNGERINWRPGEFVPLAVPELAAADALIDDWSGLTVAQVAALAAPGDDWQAGRSRAYRLLNCVDVCEPCPMCNHDGLRLYGGWIDRPGFGCGMCALAEQSHPKPPRFF